MKDAKDRLLDRTNLQFGKYRNRAPEDIAKEDPGYVLWLYNNVEPKRCSRDLALECEDAMTEAQLNDDDDDDSEPNRWARDVADD